MAQSLAEMQRTLCASAAQWDSLWTSQVIFFNPSSEDMDLLLRKCFQFWSPGFVVMIHPTASRELLVEISRQLTKLANKLGKARRITSGVPVDPDVAVSLYQSFQCVEFMNAVGNTSIVEDTRSSSNSSDQ